MGEQETNAQKNTIIIDDQNVLHGTVKCVYQSQTNTK